MKKQTRPYLTIPFVAASTLGILAVPLVAMQFTDEVKWSVSDFLLMGALLFTTGSTAVIALRSASTLAYRAAMLIAAGASFFMIWANLAVGLIGSGPNAGNFMYVGAIAVLIAAVLLSKFKPMGMARAMFVTAFAVLSIGAIALLANMQNYPGSSVAEIIGVSVCFAAPYVVAGFLFRHEGHEHVATP